LNKTASKKKTPRFSEEMIQECLLIMQSGDIEDLFEIIPRLGVLRDSRFRNPLTTLLTDRDPKKREFAAYAMGAMGNKEFLEPLKKAFIESRAVKGFGVEEVQIAIIEAIGAIGDDAAADFFLPVLKSREKSAEIPRMRKWIVESLGAIAQQGGTRSLEALLELTNHEEGELQAQSISELSVAFWHRPNDIEDSILARIYELTRDRNPIVAESAIAALQSLADVGCRRAERLFSGS
jgi:HEAT repeat protein